MQSVETQPIALQGYEKILASLEKSFVSSTNLDDLPPENVRVSNMIIDKLISAATLLPNEENLACLVRIGERWAIYHKKNYFERAGRNIVRTVISLTPKNFHLQWFQRMILVQ